MRRVLALFLFCFVFQAQAQPTIGLTQYTVPNTDGYLLYVPISGTQTYLIDKCGKKINEWSSAYKAGLSAYLLPDGTLLRSGLANSAYFGNGGGKGGVLQKFDWAGNVIWQYPISDSMQCQHHDAIALPNGNILAIVWDRQIYADAIANGKNVAVLSGITNGQLWSEKIVEIQPTGLNSGNIVWEWTAFDHLIQDFDYTKNNFDTVSRHPELIDINYVNGPPTSSDWLHFNSIDYNPSTDQVLVSSHNFDEVWIIDHSTTTAQAASHSGGNANKGGDLLYRWGNPQTYRRGNASDKKLFGQHHVHWIKPGIPNTGKISIFNNGVNRPGGNATSVDIIETPIDINNVYPISDSSSYLPDSLSWSYENPVPTDFYATNIGGAFILSNGSFIITDGPAGRVFEIDSTKNIKWQYTNPVTSAGPQQQGTMPTGNSVFRFEFYEPSYSGLSGHSLTPGNEIELSPTIPSLCSVALGTEEIHFPDFIVFPNPVDAELSVQWNKKMSVEKIQLLNISGQIIYTSKNFNQGYLYKIPVSDFTSGIYFLQAIGKTTAKTFKVVIAR